jgi:superfamily II DNA or RNA helicase
MKNEILVEMPYSMHTNRIHNYIGTSYDRDLWRKAVRERWNPYEERPIIDVGELFRVMRRIVNDDPSKLDVVRDLMKIHPKLIIFYNFNYELERLRSLSSEITIGEWNGHKKDQIPGTSTWLYLVQYTAGSEGWNCIETDAMIIYSLTYSYKNYMQAQGRIDRLDTLFGHLYYYVLWSGAPIDIAIRKALEKKRNFNERDVVKWP